MKIAVSPSNGRIVPSASAALSSRRSAGGADRDHPAARRARAALSRSAVAASIRPHSACIRWSAVSLGLDRQEGAGADMQRQRFVADPARGEPRHQSGVKCSAAVGRRDRPVRAREHRLVVVPVGLVGRALAGDVGRQRHLARAFEQDLDRLLAQRRPASSCRPSWRRSAGRDARRRTRSRSPSRSRLALRTKACQRLRSIRCAASRRSAPRRAVPRAAPGSPGCR